MLPLLRQERIVLEGSESFSEGRGIQALINRLSREILPRGTALSLLIRGAVADVVRDLEAANSPQEVRLAEFLQAYFGERRSVVEIASGLHLDRSHVSRAIRGPALALVARRFLDLAYQEDPMAESEGLAEAVTAFEQRRWGHESLRSLRPAPHQDPTTGPSTYS